MVPSLRGTDAVSIEACQPIRARHLSCRAAWVEFSASMNQGDGDRREPAQRVRNRCGRRAARTSGPAIGWCSSSSRLRFQAPVPGADAPVAGLVRADVSRETFRFEHPVHAGF